MHKILVAMSGGVDSAVAALLLKEQGYDISGAYIKTWMHEENESLFSDCPWETDMEDARKVAEKIGIEFNVINLIKEYRENVAEYLINGYRNGITPNPDVMCNREIKFGAFLQYASNNGFDKVATGHYCQLEILSDGNCRILAGRDNNKDQSYFLALLRQEQARSALFPIGHLLKPQVREIAKKYNLENAGKKDSQGICFLGKIKINDFLEQYIQQTPGDIVTIDGDVRGRHLGLHRYTIGQRKGIDVPSNTDFEHFVVVAKDYKKNQLIIGFDKPETPGLFTHEARVSGLSFIHEKPTQTDLLAKVRYRDPSTPIRMTYTGDNQAHIEFKEQQRALARGQVIALYDGDVLLGGGFYE